MDATSNVHTQKHIHTYIHDIKNKTKQETKVTKPYQLCLTSTKKHMKKKQRNGACQIEGSGES